MQKHLSQTPFFLQNGKLGLKHKKVPCLNAMPILMDVSAADHLPLISSQDNKSDVFLFNP